jgi:UDP-N-acetylmuramate dehydrogenase
MHIEQNISLKPYNTFGMDVRAARFARFSSVEAARVLLQENRRLSGEHPLILGGGSNLLFTKDQQRLVMKNEIGGIEKTGEDDQHVYVKAGAGVVWHQLVMRCIAQGWAGMENLALIPGNAGASPMQNIGAYGVEIKDIFHQLEALHIHDGTLVPFNLQDCAFGYRESVFKGRYKNQFIITAVTYRLNKEARLNTSYGAIEQELEKMGVQEPSISTVAEAVIRIRSSKLPDPAVIPNAGSFFKNPEISEAEFLPLKEAFPALVAYALPAGRVKLAAGWLIEQCGWKGFREGDAGCHEKQALVLVNYGNASGTGILALSEKIIQSVQHKFGVQLEREVNVE